MNELEAVKNKLLSHLPHIQYEYDPSELEGGSSWLDLNLDDQTINIEWKPSSGFGLYVNEDRESYGSGPTEIYRDSEIMFKRLLILFEQHKFHLKLKEIREILGVSQVELGKMLGKQQAAVSKLEARESDVLFKNICSVITALGGTLEIRAHFDSFDVPLDLSCDDNETKKLA